MVRKILRKDFLNDIKILNLSSTITEEEIDKYKETGKASIKLPKDLAEKRKQEIEMILAYRRGEKVFVEGRFARKFVNEEKRKQKLGKSINSTVGKRVNKHKANEFGWVRKLKRGEVKFDKPVVLLLPGDAANNDRSANGYVKSFIGAMGRIGVSNDEDIQILSAYYEASVKALKTTINYFKTKDESIEEEYKDPYYVRDIYNAIIRPVLFKNSKGEKQTSEIITKKLRNLTIISHCFGSVTATMLLEKLYTDMQAFKFSEKEIDQCMGEIVNISISPRTGYFNNKNKALTIGFAALDDKMLGSGYYYEELRDSSYNVEASTMGIGLKQNKNKNKNEYFYLCGDTYDYKYGRHDILKDFGFGHSFDDYTVEDFSARYWGCDSPSEESIPIYKNKNGRNFIRLVCKTFQNAVSLSALGEKRTIEQIISNEVPVSFKQGDYEDNLKTIAMKFDGNNDEFIKNYKNQIEKVKKFKLLKTASQNLEKMSEEDKKAQNISVLNQTNER